MVMPDMVVPGMAVFVRVPNMGMIMPGKRRNQQQDGDHDARAERGQPARWRDFPERCHQWAGRNKQQEARRQGK